MKRSTFFALIAILSFTLFLRALPFFQHIFWGMDEGEYLVMTEHILRTGTISPTYNGWTVAYPYFQGYFVLSSTFSSVSSISALSSLGVIIIFSILAPLSVFLMVSKIMGDSAGIGASAFVAVAAPYAYHTSLPAPESLGQALLVLTLLLLWKGGKKPMLLSTLISGAIIVSHPLSSYMLVLFLGGSILVEIFRGNEWKERWTFLLLYSTMLLFYWFFAGKGFTQGVLIHSGVSPISVIVLTYLAILSLYLIGRRIERKKFMKIGFSPDRNSYIGLFLGSLVLSIVILISLYLKVPGLRTVVGLNVVIFYMPFIVLLFTSFYGVSVMKGSSKGMETWGWLIALSLSALAGYFFNAHLLIPYRHMEYMMIPFAILFGGALYLFLIQFPKKERGGRSMLSFAAVFLILNSLIIYPPPQYMENFSESTDWDEIPSIIAASHLNGPLATDHRLSTDVFAMGKNEVSWEDAGGFFRDPWNSSYSAKYVLLSEKMAKGAIFGSGKPTEKIDKKLFCSAYAIYRDSGSSVYLWTNESS